jgi:hypothetical protein
MVRGVKIEIDTFDDELEKTMPSKMKVKPLDKRSDLINRKIAPKHQLLCYICCAEYGPSSLEIHQKTCRKKHGWAMEANILNEQVSECIDIIDCFLSKCRLFEIARHQCCLDVAGST